MSLSEALATLGLPSLEEIDRLDDAEDDEDLDEDFELDDEDPGEDSTSISSGIPP
jgi:hypothetical protein